MHPILNLIVQIIDLYLWVVIITVILSWLITFNIVNTTNRLIYAIMEFCHRATRPALHPIRNFLPNLGGIDISPIILIFILVFIKEMIFYYFR